MSRLIRIVTLSLIALALGAGPIAGPAAAGVIDHGAIANCSYKVTQSGTYGWTRALLKEIVVSPPTVAKKTGTNSVGWRFIVERSLDRENGPWKITYRSPIQHAFKSAKFTPMSVGVTVPKNGGDRDRVYYHVILKMFWYRADGSVQDKVKHPMYDMYVIVDGEELGDAFCPGVALQYFN
jgi:hypothetical protein